MHRTDTEGSTVDNKFTEGDPQLGVPATVVGSDWLNDTVQEELCQVVEYNGITLEKTSNDQLVNALQAMFKSGGTFNPINADLDNNSGPVDVEDNNNGDATFTFDPSKIKALFCEIYIERKTDSQSVNEIGTLMIAWDSKNSAFIVRLSTSGDDAGITFTMANVSGTIYKLQYTSNDLTGTTYVGTLDIISVKEIKA